jgi:hypothetical protein
MVLRRFHLLLLIVCDLFIVSMACVWSYHQYDKLTYTGGARGGPAGALAPPMEWINSKKLWFKANFDSKFREKSFVGPP